MSFNTQSRLALTFSIFGLILIGSFLPATAEPDVVRLTVTISDTTAMKGDTNAWISVYLANYEDVLAGFAMRVQLDHPNLVEFRTNAEDTTIDTTYQYCVQWQAGQCIQWRDTQIVDTVIINGSLDTAGSIIGGWQYLSARSTGGALDLKVVGLADKFGGVVHPGLPTQNEEGLLFRLKVRILGNIPDTLSDKTIYAQLVDNLSESNFSDPTGQLIGTIQGKNICDTLTINPFVTDTNWRYWKCTNWFSQDSCSAWASHRDSITWQDKPRTIDTIPWSKRDTTESFYNNGSLTVILCKCGDHNNDGMVNVGDAVFLINHIFKSGPAPVNPSCADVNHDGNLNVGDAVYMINHIFKLGAAPNCSG